MECVFVFILTLTQKCFSMETFTEEPQHFTLQDESIDYWWFIKTELNKSLEAIENTLQDLGLSRNEIQVYLYLSIYNERKASEISKALDLHRTNVYQILRDLEKKGIVSSKLEKPLKFFAVPFEEAIDILIESKRLKLQRLEKEKKQLVQVWLSLPKPEIADSQKEVFQILEGEEQITLKMAEALQKAQNEIAFFISENDIAPLHNAGLLEQLLKLPRLNVKLLTDNSPRARFFVEKLPLQNKRYTLTEANAIPTFVVIDQKYLLFMIKCTAKKNCSRAARPAVSALWTNYESLIKALNALFTELWSHGKNVPSVR